MAAAAKVAELLDRYGLSLSELDLRGQSCEGAAVETERKRAGPIDDCVPATAAFFDCRVWGEKDGVGRLRYVFFGLPADVAAARGVPTRALSIVFMLLLGLAVAVSVQVVGSLLVLAILVTPAAAALRISASPVIVPLLSTLFAVGSLVGGILLALGGSLTLLRGADDALRILNDFPLGTATARSLWDLKVVGLVVIFGYAFFKFAWSYRLFNYA